MDSVKRSRFTFEVGFIVLKKMATKFFNFDQNNSGGYFVQDDNYGISEYVIIQANSAEEAWNKLNEIGSNVDGFDEYCSCCGERWYSLLDDSDGTEKPMIYNEDLEIAKKSIFRNRVYVHYLDGSFKLFILK